MTTSITNELTVEQQKERIQDYLNFLNEEQVSLLHDILDYALNRDFKRLLKICDIDRDKDTIDTATPIDYARRIEEIYPNFKLGRHVYDYRTEMFGEMLNLNDAFMEHLLSVFSKQ